MSPLNRTSESERLDSRRVTIFGDLRLEMKVRLNGLQFSEMIENVYSISDLRLQVAGTGPNAADAFAELFESVALIARVGGNPYEIAHIKSSLAARGLAAILIEDPSSDVGLCLSIRDGSDRAVRLLIVNERAPLRRFNRADVTLLRETLQSSEVFVADTYCCLTSEGRLALEEGLRLARSLGVKSCLDLVPHDIFAYCTLEDLKPILGIADMLIVEARTLARLCGLVEIPPVVSASWVRNKLGGILSRWGGPTWVLRFGVGDVSESLVVLDGEELDEYSSEYASADPSTLHGFGDRLTARDVRLHL